MTLKLLLILTDKIGCKLMNIESNSRSQLSVFSLGTCHHHRSYKVLIIFPQTNVLNLYPSTVNSAPEGLF